DVRAALHDLRVAVEVQEGGRRVVAWRVVEDVLALVRHDRVQIGAVQLDGVDVRAETGLRVRRAGEGEEELLAIAAEGGECRRGRRRQGDDPSEDPRGVVETEETGWIREDERRG